MTDELLYFNGVNGDTGDYDLTPMSAERLFALLRGVAEPENIKELEYRVQREAEEFFGVGEGIDATRVEEAGWGVIFPADRDGTFVPAVKEALQPLLDLRREQAGELFYMFEGVNALRPNETRRDFLVRHNVAPADPANPERMPYYLLLVGDPSQIPYRFQSQLDVQYAVGRIYFETLGEYANYARSVVAAERGEVQLPKQAVFFGTANPDDPATTLSAARLVQPLHERLRQTPEWQVDARVNEAATKAQLSQLLGGESTPALLFTASHGMDFDPGSARQRHHQGALLCQEWPGPREWRGRGPIPQDYYFAGDDLAQSANLLGTIAFFFACFGGGTPQHDEFPRPGTTSLRKLAPHPFVANLPMRLLGQSKGGALATIAHVERAWGTSFQWGRSVEQVDVFKDVLTHLMAGNPVGSAMEYFNSRYATWATDLSTTLRDVEYGLQVEPADISSMWTAHNDARGYAILGDPAARLPLQQGDAAPERTAFDEPVVIDAALAGASAATHAEPDATASSAGALSNGATVPASSREETSREETRSELDAPADFAVRVEFPEAPDGDVSFGLTDTIEERSRAAIRAAMNTIQEMALQTDLMRKGIPGGSQPRMIKVKFGINLDMKAGALIAQSGVGATMEVELEWARRSDDVLRVLRAETEADEALFKSADQQDAEQ